MKEQPDEQTRVYWTSTIPLRNIDVGVARHLVIVRKIMRDLVLSIIGAVLALIIYFNQGTSFMYLFVFFLSAMTLAGAVGMWLAHRRLKRQPWWFLIAERMQELDEQEQQDAV